LALDYAREGDTLVVWKLDRLARSIRQLIVCPEAPGRAAFGEGLCTHSVYAAIWGY
jgi:hypothetical protein